MRRAKRIGLFSPSTLRSFHSRNQDETFYVRLRMLAKVGKDKLPPFLFVFLLWCLLLSGAGRPMFLWSVPPMLITVLSLELRFSHVLRVDFLVACCLPRVLATLLHHTFSHTL
ncbi:unnamed protein product [Ectocarpus sp. 6 AP-2014]